MNVSELVAWFGSTEDIGVRTLEHLRLAFSPVLAALVVGVPLGTYIGHRRRFELLVVTVANVGRAIPSFAILALALPISIRLGLGLGFWPTFAALFLLSLPPILTNAYVGVREVDPETIEASRGMGLREMQVVRQIELPLAMPLIAAGVRTAAVQSVATATLAAVVAGGGLGTYILLGLRTGRDAPTFGGAALVAALAVGTELLFATALAFAKRRSRRPASGMHLGEGTHAGLGHPA